MAREHVQTDLPSVDVAFDAEAFNEAIRSQGVKLVHYRAQRCPVGMVALNDNRRPHPHHENCFNGFIYTKTGCITALLTGNNKKKSMEDVGFVDFSTVQSTFPQTYDNSEEKLVIAPFDRFYLDEEQATVVEWQLFQHHETGLDRLKFPVACVDGPIIDARGERFLENADFVVTPQGLIQWTGRRPAQELDVGPGLGNGFGTDRGAVCSIRYKYRPYWYVGTIPHEIRIIQVQDGLDRKATRGPQMAVLHREYVGQNIEQEADQNLPSTSDELRRVMAPMYGSFSAK
jgi:hypothetical protein